MKTKSIAAALAAVAAIQFSCIAPGGAAEKKAGKAAKETIEYVNVKLHTLYAPLESSLRGGENSAPVSILARVSDEKKANFVCLRVPRLRSAILETLHEQPIRVTKKRRLDFDNSRRALLKAVNRSLGRKTVVEIVVLSGLLITKNNNNGTRPVIDCGRILKKAQAKREADRQKRTE